MTKIAGVDGCRGGWIVVLVDSNMSRRDQPMIRLCKELGEVLALAPKPRAIAIDIPIGLLDAHEPGGRPCDRAARRILGRRASTVFSPPTRRVLHATTFTQVRGHGLSLQSFNILPKIWEVDRLMTPKVQDRVYEAHPELAFHRLTGRAMRWNKKTPAGRRERVRALRTSSIPWLRELNRHLLKKGKTLRRSHVAPDDLLDAAVLTHTAYCILKGQGIRIPSDPGLDSRGLRMEIWF